MRNLYPPDTVNARRLATDTFFIDDAASVRFVGILDDTARFLESFQLLDAAQWHRFVEQFCTNADDADDGWRGEYWGKMMRGACFVYGYTKNPRLYDTLRATVEELLDAADPQGRISTYSVEKEFRGWDLWSRKYVLLGLQYFLEICPDADLKARCIAVMRRQADYLLAHFGEGKRNITQTTSFWRGLASSSLLEPIVRLYDLTGEQKYLDFAEYIVSCGGISVADIFKLALEGNTDPYQFPITKAYEMISCFEGLLELYRVTGKEDYKTATLNFARRLVATDITVIGCAGCTHELFDHSAARQTEPTLRGIMQETCVTVTWMKFCMQLLLLTGDAAFADYFEQSLYNAYLGAVNTEKVINTRALQSLGEVCAEPLPFDSYSALRPDVRGIGIGGLKRMADGHYYGCCACIGAAGIGMAPKVAVTVTREGLALNLFVAGEITVETPSGNAVTLKTQTGYPVGGRVTVTVSPAMPETFTLLVRIPPWSRRTSLSVCGEAVEAAAGGYAAVTREWRRGDTVEVTLDMSTRAIHPAPCARDVIITDICFEDGKMYMVPRVQCASPEAWRHVALRRGPLVLARDARLGEDVFAAVAVAENPDGTVDAVPAENTVGQLTLSIPQTDGTAFTVIDYGSAGKTWDDRSAYGCWLPIK